MKDTSSHNWKGTGDFDWTHVDMCGFQNAKMPMSPPNEVQRPKKPIELYVGTPSYDFLETIYIDGFKITSDKLTVNTRNRNFAVPNWKLDGISINVKLDNGLWQFIGLENILNDESIQNMKKWVIQNNPKLLSIGEEFEKFERQIYHFLYEIIALFKTREIISLDHNNILNDTNQATDLIHNRLLAEIYSGYIQKGAICELYPSTNNESKPDLKISNILIDVKSILITSNKEKERKELMNDFAKKLRKDIINKENEKQQIEDGTFFIIVWSGIISSMLYSVFHSNMVDKHLSKFNISMYKELPPLNKNKVIITIPTLDSFENYYLIFEREEICDIMDYLASEGYENINEGESMKYLVLNNIRKGCEFGVTGDNPSIVFKFR